MRYLHYSATPFAGFRPVAHQRGASMKPAGLWLSSGTAWQAKCEADDFNRHTLAHCTDLNDLVVPRRTLIIANLAGLVRFSATYGTGDGLIDWRRVAAHYDGLEVPDYITDWARGGTCTAWYETWDIGCAVLWR